MRVGGQCQVPAALPPGKTRYPLYRRLGEPQDRSGRVRKMSPPTGFDLRTVQPVASRYTDWAIPGPTLLQEMLKTISLWIDTFLCARCHVWNTPCSSSRGFRRGANCQRTFVAHAFSGFANTWFLPVRILDWAAKFTNRIPTIYDMNRGRTFLHTIFCKGVHSIYHKLNETKPFH